MSREPWSERIVWLVVALTPVALALVFLTLDVVHGPRLVTVDMVLLLLSLPLAAILIAPFVGRVGREHRERSLTERFQSPSQGRAARGAEAARRWLASHPLVDGLCRIAIHGCFGLSLLGCAVALRNSTPLPPWVLLSNTIGWMISLIRGGAGHLPRGKLADPEI
jgi:Mn2+/Fe2+ NRAMP family transporter